MARLRPLTGIAIVTALALAGANMAAQGQGGSAVPIDAAGNFEVTGVAVDVKGKDADAARLGGWRVAQRKGWEMLGQRLGAKAPGLSDSALDAIVTGIVVEREQIGPDRYIARLGVLFDRYKAASILGVSVAVTRSPPMLLVPIEFSAGTGTVFEHETGWARAWNRFKSGGSTIDYLRVRGTGADSMLVNAGQVLRRGRNWWRSVLDQYGAQDVLVAEVQLRREYPGGPVVGVFAANHGPDHRPIASFALRVANADGIDSLLDAGVARIDQAYQQALSAGMLRSDALLAVRPPDPNATPTAAPTETPTAAPSTAATADAGTTLSVQYDSPSVTSVSAAEAALRGVPGVRSAATTSLALGGISVMRVGYEGTAASLAAALESRGWQVQQGAGVLRIRRAAPVGASPSPSPTPTPRPTPRPTATPRGG